MRLQLLLLLLFAVTYGVVLPCPCKADQSDSPVLRPLMVSSTASDRDATFPSRNFSQTEESKPRENKTERPLGIKDLLFKPSSAKDSNKPLESLGVEPWMPGRGAIGVKVEVTW
jgi:hypothetical protein